MCRIFAAQAPAGYRQINRSVFWNLIDEIAERENLTTPKFLSQLYEEVVEINGEIPNFASMLRTTCVLYLREGRPVPYENGDLRISA